MGDIVATVCIPFLLTTIIAYLIVFRKQFLFLDNETNRLVILTTRLALFLPFYAILIYISLCIPVIYMAMEVPMALIEGYTFYAFFVLLVTNLGGPAETVNYLVKSEKSLFCYCCCPGDKKKFYQKATWNVFHFLFTRVIVVFFSVICSYVDTKIAKLLGVVLSLIALVQLIYGVLSVINLFEDVYSYTTNLHGVLKLLLLKMSVGLITIQGIIVELMNVFGANPYESNNDYSAEDRLQRNYCALVLVEFTLMAFVFYFAYGRKIVMPNTPYHSYVTERGERGSGKNMHPTMWWFLVQVFTFSDVFGVMTLEDESLLNSKQGSSRV